MSRRLENKLKANETKTAWVQAEILKLERELYQSNLELKELLQENEEIKQELEVFRSDCFNCQYREEFINAVTTDRGEKYELDIRCTLNGKCIFGEEIK